MGEESHIPFENAPVDESGGFPPPTLDPADAAAANIPSTQPSAPAPSTEGVQIGGREFQVPSEFAQAWRDEMRGVTSRNDETMRELEGMRGTFDQLRRVFVPESQQPDLGTQIYTDPNAAFQTLEDRIVNRIVGMDQQREAARSFWATFHQEHEELRPFERISRAVLQDPAYRQVPNTPEGRAQLAADIRQLVTGAAQQFGGSTGTPRPRLVESGGGTSRTAPSDEGSAESQESSRPVSINDAMKARRAERRTNRRTQSA